MSSPNKLLKQAKNLLAEDPDESIILIKDALNIDPKSTVAYLLLGKAYIVKGDVGKASEALRACIDIDYNNLNAWKGYFSIVKNQGDLDKFLKVSGDYSKVLVDNHESVHDLSKEVLLYVKKNNDESFEFLSKYYNALVPGETLAENCGVLIVKPEEALENLLRLNLEHESSVIKIHADKLRLKYPKTTAAVKLQEFRLSVYQKSPIESLHEQLINMTHDDNKRKRLEEDLLKYRYLILQTIPVEDKETKERYKTLLIEMINGMVHVKVPSLFAWNLYFDLNDFADTAAIDIDYLINFFQLFGGKGLANVLFGYVSSDISPFEKASFKKVREELQKREAKDKNSRRKGKKAREQAVNNESANEGTTKDESAKEEFSETKDSNNAISELEKADLVDHEQPLDNSLSEEDVLTLMVSGYQDAKDSIMAHKILTLYYVHLEEYENALTICKTGIDALMKTKIQTGFDLPNTKQFFIAKLAKIYTYYEAPKNFPVALKLYDSVLSSFPNNSGARVGKGLVFMQEGKLQEAKELLSAVVAEFPDNHDALLELSWCKIQLRELKDGRASLVKAYETITGSDLRSYEKRSVNLWRLAESYFYEAEGSEDEEKTSELVELAYDNLLSSLKINKNHAASYTSLGIIYSTYYNDDNRALKCFYKAFELDSGEIVAARYLVEDFTSKAEWEMAEVLCERMVSSQKVRRKLMSLNYDKSWPYRVLGTAALESQKGDKAIEWYQSAIRLSNSDVESWVGLGEAYLLFGRYESAIKVFNRAITIEESHWHAKYLLGVGQYLIKEFEASIQTLKSILDERPEEQCVIISLYEALVSSSEHYVEGGFFGRAIEASKSAINLLKRAAAININSYKLWKALAGVVRIFLIVQSKIDQFPFKTVTSILEGKEKDWELASDDLLDKIVSIDNVSISSFKNLQSEEKFQEALYHLLILAAKCSIISSDQKAAKILRASGWYNLGLAELEIYTFAGKEPYRDAAIESLKKAIQLESSSASYWLSLGVATVSVNPRISQHCFIKASALDPRNGEIWTNLAVLYMRYGDVELAQQTFLKAQSIAPDLAHSWIGDALMAEASGDHENASKMFTHAYVLSNGKSPLAQLMYGASVCSKRISNNDDKDDMEAAHDLTMAQFAMEKYLTQKPLDETGLEIACAIAERMGNYEGGEELASQLCGLLEEKYEESESEVVLLKFAQAKSQLARFKLGNGDYEAAIENAQFILDILGGEEEEEEEEKSADETKSGKQSDSEKCKLSAITVLGLAYYFLDEFGQSITEFKKILRTCGDSNSFIILIAQTLYNYGEPETKQAALDELFEYITKNGASLIILFTLASIAFLENDEQILTVVKDELEGLSLEQLTSDISHRVPAIIGQISERLGNQSSSLKYWQRNAIFFPNDYVVWKHLDSKIAANIGSTGQAKIKAGELSQLYAETGQLRLVQRSMLFDPTSIKPYKYLSSISQD